MVVPSRWSDIHVHGDPSYKLGEGPFWQGTEFRQGGWWHPKAALAADFHANRYALAGAGAARDALVSTTRSSSHLLAEVGGAFQSFGPNMLAVLPGIGAYVGGQVTSLVANGNNLAAPGWTNNGASIADLGSTALNLFRLVEVSSAGAVTHTRMNSALFTVASGDKIAVQVYYRAGTSGRVHLRFYNQDTSSSVITGPVGSPSVTTQDAGTLSIVGSDLLPDGVTYRTRIIWTVNFTGTTARLGIGPDSTTSGATIIALGIDAVKLGYTVPWISDASPAPTRLASDVRSASFGWFNSAGLASAFSMLAVVTLSHLGDNATRWIGQVTDGTTANRAGLFISASDRLNLFSVVGGVTVMNFQLASAVPLGRLAVAATFDPANGWYLKSSSGGFASAAAGGSLPAAPTTLYVGGQAGSVSLNDNLEQLQICRPLSQAECNAWVMAA